jgi:hypothetical protein
MPKVCDAALGALVGAVVDAGVQVAINAALDRPIHQGVGKAALGGAIGGAAGGVLGGMAKAARAAGRVGDAAAAARQFIPEGEAVLAVVKEGKILAQGHAGLSHAELVRRTVGQLPEGARVVTIGKHQGQVQVLDSRTFHGNQLPAPQDVIDAMRGLFR